MGSSNLGVLRTDPLFKGLTRPPMLVGVSYTFAVTNFLVTALVYIYTNQLFFMLVVAPTLHGIGYMICFNEPLFLELIMTKNNKCGLCANYYYHGARSYDFL